MPVITTTRGRSFSSAAGQSILDAAAGSGIALPYSCRTGRCSTCKCKVRSGASTALHDELGLTAEEKAEGWILSCVRSAEDDLTLDVEDLGNVKLPEAKTLPCRIHTLEPLAPDVMHVKLRLPPTADFTALPGQYIDVIGPGGIRRSYSLAAADLSGKILELHIRAVDNGAMSAYWFGQAKVNDLLRLRGPLGTFFLRPPAGQDLVFLATGTGIAPVKAMLEELATLPATAQPRSVSVYWGGRTAADLYLDSAALAGARAYVPVLSRADEDWSGARGHVQQVLLAGGARLAGAIVYACGSPAMIRDAKIQLVQAGLEESNFFSDAFVSSSASDI
jgi:CDP-4-dehydro-6-deoxyglucose reductase